MHLDGIRRYQKAEYTNGSTRGNGREEEEEFTCPVVFVGEFVFLGRDFASFEDGGQFFGVGGEVFEVELTILDAHCLEFWI